jgi:ribonuclease BN (tRNA processing enzyme)
MVHGPARPRVIEMTEGDRVRIRVLGCGDAFASGGRFQSAYLLEIGERRVLMDCGATTLVSMVRAGIDPASIDLILISHLHGDHFGGLPFLLLDQHYRGARKHPLTIAGPAGIAARLTAVLAALFPGAERLTFGFPLKIETLRPGGRVRIHPVEIQAMAVEHPSGASSLGLRLEALGRRLAYSGDTRWTDSLTKLAEDTDLFICECYGYERHLDHHLTYSALCAKRERLKTRRLVLTHLGRDMLERRDQLDIEVLDDGTIIDL